MRRIVLLAGALIVGSGLAARAALPIWLEGGINRELARLEVYQGRIEGVELCLSCGGYRIRQIEIRRRAAEADKPLFTAESLSFVLIWRDLLHGRLQSAVRLEGARINFIDGEGSHDQTGHRANWRRLFDELSPWPVARLQVRDSQAHFFNFAGAHVYLDDVNGGVTGLNDKSGTARPARLSVRGLAMAQAPARLKMQLAPDAPTPDFALKFRMTDMNLADYRLLTKTYAPFDIDGGEMDLVMELDVKENRVDGYAKPFLRELDIISLDKDIGVDGDHPLRLLSEAMAAIFLSLVKNQGDDDIATRIPISGRIDDVDQHWLPALGSVLSHAFLQRIRPNYESENRGDDTSNN